MSESQKRREDVLWMWTAEQSVGSHCAQITWSSISLLFSTRLYFLPAVCFSQFFLPRCRLLVCPLHCEIDLVLVRAKHPTSNTFRRLLATWRDRPLEHFIFSLSDILHDNNQGMGLELFFKLHKEEKNISLFLRCPYSFFSLVIFQRSDKSGRCKEWGRLTLQYVHFNFLIVAACEFRPAIGPLLICNLSGYN